MIARFLALLSGTAGQVAVEPPTRVVLELAPAHDVPVGDGKLTMPAFQPVPEEPRGAARGRETRVTILGVEQRLLLPWPEGEELPAELVWLRGDSKTRVPLAWNVQIPGRLAIATVPLPDDLRSSLFLAFQEGEVHCTWRARSLRAASFDLEGEEQEAWFLDANLDGKLAGTADRWIAGPREHLRSLELANPDEELRPLDEPWCLGEHWLQVAEVSSTSAVLECSAPGDREALLRKHYERVQAEFVQKLPERRTMLQGQGEDPERPAATDPVRWYFARGLDEAFEYADREELPLLVEFTSFSCSFCRLLTYVTHPDQEVDEELRRFACVKIVAEVDRNRTWEKLGASGFPTTALIDDSGEIERRIDGFLPPSQFAAELRAWSSAAAAPEH